MTRDNLVTAGHGPAAAGDAAWSDVLFVEQP
jgi:hypothetical protein